MPRLGSIGRATSGTFNQLMILFFERSNDGVLRTSPVRAATTVTTPRRA